MHINGKEITTKIVHLTVENVVDYLNIFHVEFFEYFS